MSKYDYLHALYQALIPLGANERNAIMREVENKFRAAEENKQDEQFVTDELGSPKEYAKQFLSTENRSDDISTEDIADNISLDSLKSEARIITEPANLVGHFEKEISSLELRRDLPTAKTPEPLEPTHYEQPKTEIKKVYTSPRPIVRTQKANHPIKMLVVAFAMLLFNSVFVLGPFVAVWSVIIAFVASGFALAISGVVVIFSGLLSFPLSFVSVPMLFISHPVLLFSFGALLTGAGGLLTVATIYMIRFFGYLTIKYFGWNLSVIRGY